MVTGVMGQKEEKKEKEKEEKKFLHSDGRAGTQIKEVLPEDIFEFTKETLPEFTPRITGTWWKLPESNRVCKN